MDPEEPIRPIKQKGLNAEASSPFLIKRETQLIAAESLTDASVI
jgi:hypothetical protein